MILRSWELFETLGRHDLDLRGSLEGMTIQRKTIVEKEPKGSTSEPQLIGGGVCLPYKQSLLPPGRIKTQTQTTPRPDPDQTQNQNQNQDQNQDPEPEPEPRESDGSTDGFCAQRYP